MTKKKKIKDVMDIVYPNPKSVSYLKSFFNIMSIWFLSNNSQTTIGLLNL